MRKFLIILSLVFLGLTSTACTKKILYLTPAVEGYVYENVSKKPIKEQFGVLGFNGLTGENAPKIKIEKNGHFEIAPVTKSYYFIRPNVLKYNSMPPEIYIEFDGYEGKVIDYSKFYGEQVSQDKTGFQYYKKININIVYLDREE